MKQITPEQLIRLENRLKDLTEALGTVEENIKLLVSIARRHEEGFNLHTAALQKNHEVCQSLTVATVAHKAALESLGCRFEAKPSPPPEILQ